NRRDETAVPELLWLLWAVLACLSGGRPRGRGLPGGRGCGVSGASRLVVAWGVRPFLAGGGRGHRGRLGAPRFFGGGAACLVWELPPAGAMLCEEGGPLPRIPATGGLCHLRQAPSPGPAARRRVSALRPGRLIFETASYQRGLAPNGQPGSILDGALAGNL